jgi:hypothetical protein
MRRNDGGGGGGPPAPTDGRRSTGNGSEPAGFMPRHE